jgi:pyridoxal biosynthesis lyase PdxS
MDIKLPAFRMNVKYYDYINHKEAFFVEIIDEATFIVTYNDNSYNIVKWTHKSPCNCGSTGDCGGTWWIDNGRQNERKFP